MNHQFDGYPDNFEFSGIPKTFFSRVMPLIDDIGELKVTLIFLRLLFANKRHPRFVTELEIAAEIESQLNLEQIREAMTRSAGRNNVIELDCDNGAKIYLLNDASGRKSAALIESGEVRLPEIEYATRHVPAVVVPDIFSIYEQNIGLITPIIADELKAALNLYSEGWVRDAITEAAKLNKRNWRYISKILDNRAVQGTNDGTHQRDIQKSPDKYVKGRYGKFVQR